MLVGPKLHLKPSNLHGISEENIEEHFQLYLKYIENFNKLSSLVGKLTDRTDFAAKTLRQSLAREISYDRNSIILHELFFANLKANGKFSKSKLSKIVEKQYGSIERFLEDFKTVALSKGQVWALTVFDYLTSSIKNILIDSHNRFVPLGIKPLLVVDMFEHSFIRDYKASEKKEYLEAVLNNINWDVVDKRLKSVKDF